MPSVDLLGYLMDPCCLRMRKSRGLLPTGTDMRRKVARVIPGKQELLDALHELSTEPFRNLLAEALDAAPSPEALAKMAKDRPSDWATLVFQCTIHGTTPALAGLSPAHLPLYLR